MLTNRNTLDSRKYLFVGDIHVNYEALQDIEAKEKPYTTFQVGDFGIWPRLAYPTKFESHVYFCKGNHDWHDYLDIFPKKEGYVILPDLDDVHGLNTGTAAANLRYCPNGTVLWLHKYAGAVCNKKPTDDLEDYIGILFVGGARSIDRDLRTPYASWWPSEEMYDDEYEDMLEHVAKTHGLENIGIVISHTLPKEIALRKFSTDLPLQPDHTSNQLQHLYEHLPNCFLWVAGHFHIFDDTIHDDATRFISLGHYPESGHKGYMNLTLKEIRDEQDRFYNRVYGTTERAPEVPGETSEKNPT